MWNPFVENKLLQKEFKTKIVRIFAFKHPFKLVGKIVPEARDQKTKHRHDCLSLNFVLGNSDGLLEYSTRSRVLFKYFF